jgi:hypothetical protein
MDGSWACSDKDIVDTCADSQMTSIHIHRALSYISLGWASRINFFLTSASTGQVHFQLPPARVLGLTSLISFLTCRILLACSQPDLQIIRLYLDLNFFFHDLAVLQEFFHVPSCDVHSATSPASISHWSLLKIPPKLHPLMKKPLLLFFSVRKRQQRCKLSNPPPQLRHNLFSI